MILLPSAKIESMVDLVRLRLQQDPAYDVAALWRELEPDQRRDLIDLVNADRGDDWLVRLPHSARFRCYVAGQR